MMPDAHGDHLPPETSWALVRWRDRIAKTIFVAMFPVSLAIFIAKPDLLHTPTPPTQPPATPYLEAVGTPDFNADDTVVKQCGRCKNPAPRNAGVGQKCMYCGARWNAQQEQIEGLRAP